MSLFFVVVLVFGDYSQVYWCPMFILYLELGYDCIFQRNILTLVCVVNITGHTFCSLCFLLFSFHFKKELLQKEPYYINCRWKMQNLIQLQLTMRESKFQLRYN